MHKYFELNVAYNKYNQRSTQKLFLIIIEY